MEIINPGIMPMMEPCGQCDTDCTVYGSCSSCNGININVCPIDTDVCIFNH